MNESDFIAAVTQPYNADLIPSIIKYLETAAVSVNICNFLTLYYDCDAIVVQINNTLEKMPIDMVTDCFNNCIQCNIFLPMTMNILVTKLYDAYLPKVEINKIATDICLLYSKQVRILLTVDDNIRLLYKSYFSKNESLKITSMLNLCVTILEFDIYKIHLIQILLTKLMIAEKIVKNRLGENDKVVSYLIVLKFKLSKINNSKYNYLFSAIVDLCTSILFSINATYQLTYISDNLDSLLDYDQDDLWLDNFIIKSILNKSYGTLVSTEYKDSDEVEDIANINTYDKYAEATSVSDDTEIEITNGDI